MKVKEIMTAGPKACTLTDNLAEAARLMWEEDCGIVPVVAEGGRVGRFDYRPRYLYGGNVEGSKRSEYSNRSCNFRETLHLQAGRRHSQCAKHDA